MPAEKESNTIPNNQERVVINKTGKENVYVMGVGIELSEPTYPPVIGCRNERDMIVPAKPQRTVLIGEMLVQESNVLTFVPQDVSEDDLVKLGIDLEARPPIFLNLADEIAAAYSQRTGLSRFRNGIAGDSRISQKDSNPQETVPHFPEYFQNCN